MRFTDMILNDFYYMFIALTFISMIVFFVCFVRFVYKDLGGVKVGKDAFLRLHVFRFWLEV